MVIEKRDKMQLNIGIPVINLSREPNSENSMTVFLGDIRFQIYLQDPVAFLDFICLLNERQRSQSLEYSGAGIRSGDGGRDGNSFCSGRCGVFGIA